MPSAKPEIAGVDFHLSLLQGMNSLSLHQFISMSFVWARVCLIEWKTTWLALDTTLLPFPSHLPYRWKIAQFCAQILLLFTDNLKAEIIWKIEETTEAAHNLSYTAQRYSDVIEEDYKNNASVLLQEFVSLFYMSPDWPQQDIEAWVMLLDWGAGCVASTMPP